MEDLIVSIIAVIFTGLLLGSITGYYEVAFGSAIGFVIATEIAKRC